MVYVSATTRIPGATAALIIVTAAVLVLAWRNPNGRIYLFCAVWGLLTIAPALNLNALWTLVEDRYLYAPSFGWSLAVAVAVCQIAAAGSRTRKAVGAAMAALLVLYAASTMQAEGYWRNDVAFSKRCLEIMPYNLDYREGLVAAMNKTGDFEGAARTLQGGVTLNPSDAHMRLKLAQQYKMMGRELDSERELLEFNELSNVMIRRQRAAQSSSGSGDTTSAVPSP